MDRIHQRQEFQFLNLSFVRQMLKDRRNVWGNHFEVILGVGTQHENLFLVQAGT